ncbi:hypothetical protein ABE179_07195 [Aliarcobacter skirrowii]|uniref:hypothetical protein n=1 Tax=Aliarcobacter skirrowii TaxID=28200 RepID=UPI0032079E8A
MKKIVIGILVILGVLYFIGSNEEIAEEKENKSSKVSSAKVSSIKKYMDLPIKEDLSYFINPRNIAGQVIQRIDNSPLSAYEKGLEVGGKRNIREERLDSLFKIDRRNAIAVALAEIDSSNFSEFEISDFEKKLKEEFSNSIKLIRNNYKKVDNHIRIVNLNIPVKYSKRGDNVAIVQIDDIEQLKKLNSSQNFLLSNFVKEVLDNKYISQFIKESSQNYKFETIIEYSDSYYSGGLKVEANSDILNNIGKNNKGVDTITELTLHAFQPYAYSSSHETPFVITSFKLGSSDKRFVIDRYINLIDSIQSVGNKYIIRNDDVDMFIKN